MESRCWKTIGVWGSEEPRCPRLEEVIHCRNCDQFTQAGRNLLERELPEEYQSEWGEIFAVKKIDAPVGTIALVIFRIEDEWLSLPAKLFAEIVDLRPVHTLPHKRNPVLLGLINIHGEIQICVSLKDLIGLESKEENEPTEKKEQAFMMMVIKNDERWVFPVNEISEIYHIHPDILQNVPVSVSKSKSAFSKGIFKWKNRNVAFLDDELLFYTLRRNIQ
jgi:chemotaxis-related protein WspD